MIQSSFDIALEYILRREGGLEEDKKGGLTNFGISFNRLKETLPENLRLYGIHSPVDNHTILGLNIDQVKAFYRGEFWNHAPFDKIISQSICTYLFDMAINMNIAPAVKCAQRACWAVLHDRNSVLDDGVFGEKTLNAINKCSPYLLLPAMRAERGGEYRLIVQRKPDEEKYLNGWLNRAYNGS